MAVALALLITGTVQAEDQPASALMLRANEVLAKGDGRGAAVYLDRAMQAGSSRADVAAAMGEALIIQGDLIAARKWLGPGKFGHGQEAYGFRMLARLERREGRLGAAGQAYDQALGFTPQDPLLWVEIGRLRYAGGEELQAIEAAERAVEYGPEAPRALEFRAELVRDQFGGAAALAWYERALIKSPDDLDLLTGYAATLGDLGRARDMLAVTRRVLDLEPGHARALLLQATLAARGGNWAVTRSLLDKAGDGVADIPAALLLRGAGELRVGNPQAAAQPLVRLLEQQPANQSAQLLYARALYEAGEFRALIERLSTVADRPDAPSYLLQLIGRAHEALGQRDLAAPWLDRAAALQSLPISPILPFDDPRHLADAYAANPESGPAYIGYLRYLLVSGQPQAAQAAALRNLSAHPGSGQAHSLLGDVLLVQGQGDAAFAQYDFAAKVRLDETLLARMAGALEAARKPGGAGPLVSQFLARNPGSKVAARLAANGAAAAGDWATARVLLQSLVQRGGQRDARLLADLAMAQLNAGDSDAAQATATRAYALQRSSGSAAMALGLVLVERGENKELAAALLDKAVMLEGENPLTAKARQQLASR